MPTFDSRPLRPSRDDSPLSRLTPKVRRRPFLFFGLPFVATVVAGSYGLSQLTQTRYDYNATKVQSLSKEEELGMRKDRRRVDIREEYYRLQSKDSEMDDWEPKRIARPAGVPEWGVPPEDASSSSNKIHAEEIPASQRNNSTLPPSGRKKGEVVLGPDGKPCRACNSKLAFSAAMRGAKGTSSSKDQFGNAAGSALTADSLTNVSGDDQNEIKVECPPDGEIIGHSTWTFLHSVAAYYPSKPTEIQRSSMLSLVRSLGHLYPCHSCAIALGEELGREEAEGKSWESGPTLKDAVRNGETLRRWLCGVHNEVNQRLGKETWKCDETTMRERWLDGPEDGSCDQ